MVKKNIFLFIAIIYSVAVFAQKTTIRGVAKAYANQEIGVWVYKDYLSRLYRQVTAAKIDAQGNFVLQFENKNIEYLTLKIGKYITSLYAQPAADYEVEILPPDSLTYQNPNLEHDVAISIKLSNKTEINALTIDYDKRFDDFLTNEYLAFVSGYARPKIDSFKNAMFEFYSTVNNDYFKNYITYSIAAMEEKTNFSRKKIYDTYLKGKPILYNHVEYFNFFNTFYKDYFKVVANGRNKVDVSAYIDKACSYSGLMKILLSDPFLQNDTIRELVVIKGLYESYYSGFYNRDSIYKVVEQVTQQGLNENNRNIAQNILSTFPKLQQGSMAPLFTLPDKLGVEHSLQEFRGKKYVYLFFFKSNSSSSLQQMKVIPSLKKKYGKDVQFIALSEDEDMSTLRNFLKKNMQYDWLFLFDNGGLIKKEYEIKVYPTYFLIDPNGNFVQVPALSPEENIDYLFAQLLNKPKPATIKVGDKKNK